mmetsp:Transcript_38144/g.96513  ORF Transcript_38144/g.96513 Transcript_38144/m.96513 type:complete len:252 (+) Transcript_38144:663-1418(+)
MSGTTCMVVGLGVPDSSTSRLTFLVLSSLPAGAPPAASGVPPSPLPLTPLGAACGLPLGGARMRRYLSTARRPTLVLAKGSDCVKGVGPTPVLQMHSPYGSTVPSVSVTSCSVTCFTMPLRRLTPLRMSLRAAYSRRDASNDPSTSRASTTVTRMARALSGYRRLRSWLIKSVSSPATSTPVGPPPTITMCSSRCHSSCDLPGMPALATLSMSRARMASAWCTSRRKCVCCSTPGMPNVEPWLPVASTSLS